MNGLIKPVWTRAMAVGAACIFGVSLGATEVVLTGPMDEDLKTTLTGGSLLVEQSQAEEPTSSRETVSAAQADYQRLVAVLYDQGYFGPSVSIRLDGLEASDISPINAPSTISKVAITVDPGARFAFGRATVTPLPPGAEMPETFAEGQPASLGAMRDAVGAGVNAWRDAGHPKAELDSQSVTARHRDYKIDAALTLRPGPQLRFGPLVVGNESSVRSERILEIAGLPEGEVFSPQELRKSSDRLRRTGAFSSVAMIEQDGIGPNGTQDITVQVADAKPRRIGFGGEVSSFDGIELAAYWMHRNILGGAERLRFDASISGVGAETGGIDWFLGLRFDRPATFNEDTSFYALVEAEQENEENYLSRTATIGAGIERIASENRTYRFGLALRYGETESFFGDNEYFLFMVPIGLTFDYRDNLLDARSGYYAQADAAPFLAIDGADNGILSTADLRGYYSFGETKNLTFAVRGQVGSLFGPSLATSPADFLFYSGGGGTVRGQDYEGLGVDVGGGNVVGGRSFLNFSAEVRWRTAGALGLVGFFDAGYIGEEEFPDGSGVWHSGAGLGVRYDTGIGPIRVDLAVPTSGPEPEDSWYLYIGIGQAF